MVSAGDVDSSSWLSGVTAPPDREHSVCSSFGGRRARRDGTWFRRSDTNLNDSFIAGLLGSSEFLGWSNFKLLGSFTLAPSPGLSSGGTHS